MKQVIIIRKDLKMRRGKEIAQGSHASSKFLIDLLIRKKSLSQQELDWINSGMRKICLQVESEQDLVDLYQKACNAGLTTHIITDSGLTEFSGIPTKTCVAIGPNEDALIDSLTGGLKLY